MMETYMYKNTPHLYNYLNLLIYPPMLNLHSIYIFHIILTFNYFNNNTKINYYLTLFYSLLCNTII